MKGTKDTEFTVDDSEGLVDRRVKERMLSNREEIDDWKTQLFTEVKMGGLDHDKAVLLWRDRVVDYLISLEPIIRVGELPKSDEVYEERTIGTVVVEPPEEYRQQQATIPAANSVRQRENELLLSTPPQPQHVEIVGLKSIIENEAVRAQWEIDVESPDSPGPRVQTRTIEETAIIPKQILQKSVRIADRWLQNAGIGLSMSPEYRGET